MVIVCPKCKRQYQIDTTRIPNGGTTFSCWTCRSVVPVGDMTSFSKSFESDGPTTTSHEPLSSTELLRSTSAHTDQLDSKIPQAAQRFFESLAAEATIHRKMEVPQDRPIESSIESVSTVDDQRPAFSTEPDTARAPSTADDPTAATIDVEEPEVTPGIRPITLDLLDKNRILEIPNIGPVTDPDLASHADVIDVEALALPEEEGGRETAAPPSVESTPLHPIRSDAERLVEHVASQIVQSEQEVDPSTTLTFASDLPSSSKTTPIANYDDDADRIVIYPDTDVAESDSEDILVTDASMLRNLAGEGVSEETEEPKPVALERSLEKDSSTTRPIVPTQDVAAPEAAPVARVGNTTEPVVAPPRPVSTPLDPEPVRPFSPPPVPVPEQPTYHQQAWVAPSVDDHEEPSKRRRPFLYIVAALVVVGLFLGLAWTFLLKSPSSTDSAGSTPTSAQPIQQSAQTKQAPPPPPQPGQLSQSTTQTPPSNDLPSGSGSYTVQVQSSPDESAAQRFVDQLKSAGFDAYVMRADLGQKGVWYRVRVGRLATSDEARKLGNQLRSKGLAREFIVQRIEESR